MATGIAAVIGGNGQLGSDLIAAFGRRGYDARALTHAELRVENERSVADAIAAMTPAVVVNTAAFHVPAQCEAEPERAFAVNAVGARNVARAAEAAGAACVYVSTDYVFDGAKRAPYVEQDARNPLNVYGASKAVGEDLAMASAPGAIVARVSGLYGTVPCRAKGTNFVMSMLRAARERPEVRVVTDEILTPTPSAVAADAIAELVEVRAAGTFHLTCEGECSWYEFARAIFDEAGLTTPLLPITSRDLPPAVARPAYSVLDNAAWRALGRPALPHWRAALGAFLGDFLRAGRATA
ncbi:MAG TPA: dTDP-4-dehydrorhamnose reductase [Gemmatimonadaceae bacterium]|nr:dTDP-4-dehydrorhamnose reductase [Gemmatimonadaceae bacterium]